MSADSELTRDAIFNRKVVVWQPRKGYRFSIDAILLAWFTSELPGRRILELGTGSAVVSLALATRNSKVEITAVEVQERLFELAKKNVKCNQIENIKLVKGDLVDFQSRNQRFDIVCSNPPFRKVGHGRLNPDPEKAIARHELRATLRDILACSKRNLQECGYVSMIILAERQDELEETAENMQLKIIQRTDILPFPDRKANLLLYLLANDSKLDSLPLSALAIWKTPSVYTEKVEEILAGKWSGISHPLRPITE